MNKLHHAVAFALSAGCRLAQNVAVFPDDYTAVPEGTYSSRNLPLAYGTSRVHRLYAVRTTRTPLAHNPTPPSPRQLTTLRASNSSIPPETPPPRHIWVVNADGRGRRQLTHHSARDQVPTMRPR